MPDAGAAGRADARRRRRSASWPRPRSTATTPWWDYETWALETSASKSTAYTWNHTYGPLNWPRDGRELLRVKAQRPAYWKTENLDTFDGRRWLRTDQNAQPDEVSPNQPDRPALDADDPRLDPQPAHGAVRHRRLRDHRRPAARGLAADGRRAVHARAHAAARRHLRRHGLHAAPDRGQRARGRHRLPARPAVTTDDPVPVKGLAVRASRNVSVVVRRRSGARPHAARRRAHRRPRAATPSSSLEQSDLSRGMDDRQAAQARRRTPRRTTSSACSSSSATGVLLQRGRRRSRPTRWTASCSTPSTGYCQQFSGAMALLLRMGGIPRAWPPASRPARPTPRPASTWCATSTRTRGSRSSTRAGAGSRSTPRRPTRPRAASRPTRATSPVERLRTVPSFGAGDVAAQRSGGPVAGDDGIGWWRSPLLLAGRAAVGALALRRRAPLAPGAPPALSELERALRRTAPRARPRARRCTRSSCASRPRPAAVGYVRALREPRYRETATRTPRARSGAGCAPSSRAAAESPADSAHGGRFRPKIRRLQFGGDG